MCQAQEYRRVLPKATAIVQEQVAGDTGWNTDGGEGGGEGGHGAPGKVSSRTRKPSKGTGSPPDNSGDSLRSPKQGSNLTSLLGYNVIAV